MSDKLIGAKNCYICPNGHQTVTINLDSGTTPFMIGCKQCDEMAQSLFYRVPMFAGEPRWGWRLATDLEIANEENEDQAKYYRGAGMMLVKVNGRQVRSAIDRGHKQKSRGK